MIEWLGAFAFLPAKWAELASLTGRCGSRRELRTGHRLSARNAFRNRWCHLGQYAHSVHSWHRFCPTRLSQDNGGTPLPRQCVALRCYRLTIAAAAETCCTRGFAQATMLGLISSQRIKEYLNSETLDKRNVKSDWLRLRLCQSKIPKIVSLRHDTRVR